MPSISPNLEKNVWTSFSAGRVRVRRCRQGRCRGAGGQAMAFAHGTCGGRRRAPDEDLPRLGYRLLLALGLPGVHGPPVNLKRLAHQLGRIGLGRSRQEREGLLPAGLAIPRNLYAEHVRVLGEESLRGRGPGHGQVSWETGAGMADAARTRPRAPSAPLRWCCPRCRRGRCASPAHRCPAPPDDRRCPPRSRGRPALPPAGPVGSMAGWIGSHRDVAAVKGPHRCSQPRQSRAQRGTGAPRPARPSPPSPSWLPECRPPHSSPPSGLRRCRPRFPPARTREGPGNAAKSRYTAVTTPTSDLVTISDALRSARTGIIRHGTCWGSSSLKCASMLLSSSWP